MLQRCERGFSSFLFLHPSTKIPSISTLKQVSCPYDYRTPESIKCTQRVQQRFFTLSQMTGEEEREEILTGD